MADVTVVIKGVTYEITDHSSGSGLSAADVERIVTNTSQEVTVSNMAADLANSATTAHRTVVIEIDKPGQTETKTIDLGGGVYGINIDSDGSKEIAGYGYKKKDSGFYDNPAQTTADQQYVHELAHLHDYRINGAVPGDPESEDYATGKENSFLRSLGLPERDRE